MHPITATLTWLGERAGWSLAAGMVIALALPPFSPEALGIALPLSSACVLAVAFARLNPSDITRQGLDGRERRHLLFSVIALIPISLALTTALSTWLQLDPTLALCLALFAASPPIASGAAICFMLGFDAVLALQLTVAITLLTPLLGPLCLVWIAGIDLPVSATDLIGSLAAIIGGAVLLGVTFRQAVGTPWVAQHPRALDGLAALAMFGFVVPMFGGVKGVLFANWALTAGVLVLVFVLNLGVNLLVRSMAKRRVGNARAGAYGLLSGNRNIALYYASLPPDPLIGLFVALYQVPMFLSPLLLKRISLRSDQGG